MSTVSKTYAPNNNSSTTFRAWGGAISAALDGFGWKKLALAGTIDWSTVAAPSAAQTWVGWEVWRFDDALQAAAPVYLKLQYGSGTDATYPNFRVTAGTTQDGLGGVGGTLGTLLVTCTYNTGSSAANPMQGSPGSLAARLFAGDTIQQHWLWIERRKGTDGTPNASGLVMAYANTNGVGYAYVQTLDFVGARTDAHNALRSVVPNLSGARGADIAVYPVRALADRRETEPLHGLVIYYSGDLTTNVPVPVACWDGVVRTYNPTGIVLPKLDLTGSSYMLAQLWE